MTRGINTSLTLDEVTYRKYLKWRKVMKNGGDVIRVMCNALESLTAFEQKHLIDNDCLPEITEYRKEIKSLLDRVEVRYKTLEAELQAKNKEPGQS